MWVDQKQYRHVGDALAAAREQAGVTQKDLARALRKPQSFVSNVERGQRRVDVLELIRIAEALDADPLEVFGDIVTRQRHALPPAARRARLQSRPHQRRTTAAKRS